MKVLQVNCVYGTGSTGKLVCDIHHGLLAEGMDSVVCYGRGVRVDEPGVHKVCAEGYSKLNNAFSRLTGVMYGGCFFSTNKLIRVIKAERPDVVHLHCINGYFVNIFRLIEWLKRNRIRTILTLHAEFMYTGSCGYALDCDKWKTGCGNCPRFRRETRSWLLDNTALSHRKMKKAFEGFDADLLVTSVSPWLMDRAEQSDILGGKRHHVVQNGIDTDIFRPYDTEELRRKHGLKDERIIFHATPYFTDDREHIKGGFYVLKLAEMLRDQNVKIMVAGDHAEHLKVPPNVILLGRINDQRELARYYSLADVTVLTSKKETFSLVTAESLCCGTPVAGFEAGAPEQIAIPAYSDFQEWGRVDLLGRAVRRLLRAAYDGSAIADCARMKYSKDRMVAAYSALYTAWEEVG